MVDNIAPDVVEVDEDERVFRLDVPTDTDRSGELYEENVLFATIVDQLLEDYYREEPNPVIDWYTIEGFFSVHAGETVEMNFERLGFVGGDA